MAATRTSGRSCSEPFFLTDRRHARPSRGRGEGVLQFGQRAIDAAKVWRCLEHGGVDRFDLL